MELILYRNTFTNKSTIGDLYIDHVFQCHILEDVDRGLTAEMPLSEIKQKKVWGQTCIPYGRYKIIVTKSERFSKMKGKDVYLPILLNVHGFEGVRIHKGNRPDDTEGCLITGTDKITDWVNNSATAFIKLNDKINEVLKHGEDVYITISKDVPL